MSRRQPMMQWCLCMGVGLLGLFGSMLPIFSDAEEALGLHLLYRLRGVQKPRADVVIVAIDNASAETLSLPLSSHTWPRRLHSRLLASLAERQVSVVAFDMIFHESQDGGDDPAFAAAIRRAGNVVLTQTIDRKTLTLYDENGGQATDINIEQTLSAIPVLAEAAVGQAPFPLPKVPVKLNQFWCFRSASGNMPTLPVVAFHIYAAKAFGEFVKILRGVDPRLASRIHLSGNADWRLSAIVQLIQPIHALFENDTTLASRALSALEQYPPGKISAESFQQIRALINLHRHGNSRYLNLYGPPGTIPTISYHQLVLAPGADTNGAPLPIQKGTAVFVGQTASSWSKPHDGFYTAFSNRSGQDISGVEIAATALANLLEDRAVYPISPALVFIPLLAWGVVATAISIYRSTWFAVVGLLAISGIYFFAALLHFTASGVWYPLVVPLLLQVPMALITGLTWNYRQATRERENIREAFGYYLPDAVVDRLVANTKALHLGGQVFYGICLFTDAQNYTTLSETMDPGRLTDLMNAYYEAIFKPIKSNGGLVLQVVGDSVLAIWAAPEMDKRLKTAACRAALAIAAEVNRFNRQVGDCAMPTRIGIHSGEILLGNIGAMDHFEYRPVGDIVNTASRLEGLNKFLRSTILVSSEALGTGHGAVVRPVGRFVFKGKSQPVGVHELLPQEGADSAEQTVMCRTFAEGLTAFERGDWKAADGWFEKVLQIDATDGPSLFYRQHCRMLQDAPPGTNWQGVVHLEQK